MITKKSLRFAALPTAAVAAICVLQASATAAPTQIADTVTSLSADHYRPWSTQLWLGASPTFPFEQPPTAPAIGDWSSDALSSPPLYIASVPAVARSPVPRLVATETVRPEGAPTAAPIDISMKPVTGSADTLAPRLQSAIYTRPDPPPAAVERRAAAPVVGQAGAPDIFGSVALLVGHTPEDAKWRRVADYVPPAGAGPWSPLIARARRQSIGEQVATVNAWVNHAISYSPDLANYGVADYWGTARESLTRGRGDCKDYAIAKMELLRALGMPSDDLYLVLVKDLVRRQDHAVLAVRMNGRFVVLDSGFDGVMDSEETRDYRPILTFSAGRTWVHGFRRTQDVMVASATTSAPDALATQ